VKVALLLSFGILLFFVAIELVLRYGYGLGTPPVYIADAQTGYRVAPNQKTRRRGKRIEINRYSMRSEDFSLRRPDGTLRLLFLGDSIVSGGWLTDQSQIITQFVQDCLSGFVRSQFPKLEVLNASANSWGPRNELGYVKKFGLFESQIVVMVLNTEDLFAVEPHSLVLGRARSHPTRRPLAIVDFLNRYRKPVHIPALRALKNQPGDRVKLNLEAIQQVNQLAQDQHSRLLVAITPLKREVGEGSTDSEKFARERLERFLDEQNIPLLDFLPIFQQKDCQGFYFDRIHITPEGNRFVGEVLSHFIYDHLPEGSLPSSPASRGQTALQDESIV
jgi:hypothetical protein